MTYPRLLALLFLQPSFSYALPERLNRQVASPGGKRAVQSWYAQKDASWNLQVVSQPEELKDTCDLDFVYESTKGEGIYIYVLDTGVETGLHSPTGPEFPHRLPSLQTWASTAYNKLPETDDNELSHGTGMASLALGQQNGVAKGATLISVKHEENLDDVGPVFGKVHADLVKNKDRQGKSIVLCATHDPYPLIDPNDWPVDDEEVLEWVQWKEETKKWLDKIMNMGVPIVVPAGNEALQPERAKVDFWPSSFSSDDFPLIVVGATDADNVRYAKSQTGPQVTAYAPGQNVVTFNKAGILEEVSGTSYASALVAGLIAGFMSQETPPWQSGLQGRARVAEIRRFIKEDGKSGWKRPNVNGKTAERVIWNGATKKNHEEAVVDPGAC
ncbi:peptidase S8/S53 domain-containing protein [Massariosphaeria phaeospora]|uniref:Peptidase S8/S53 domain-containing protein n=1 Tax=Massariosphaeria phaeospora TaxID=100035 RepID=A0A7C8I3U3_9PLEO|nr:peptidase S8/S53 domain-containing protein [Massariosphaeria phaeospora]